ncbi:WD40-repeat containing protein [Gracilaria domingensis]|nr:WD40-repeat containing protein [Gracilaria domingensis]
MSGIEVVGLVFGVLGALEQVINLTNDVRQRRQAQRTNAQTTQRLLNRLEERRNGLSHLHQQLCKSTLVLPHINEEQFQFEIEHVRQLFEEMGAALSELGSQLSKRSCFSCVTQYCAAMSITSELDAICAKLNQAEQIIISVRSLFVLGAAIATNTDKIMRHQSRKINVLQEAITENLNRDRDVFTPSKARAWIPLHTVCDFDSSDHHGTPSTLLARLKLDVLSPNRRESFMISLHGEGGIGKTTAIRALSLHPEIRKCYTDGIYDITLGLDATEATLVLELCKIVRQSGGRHLADTLQTRKQTRDVLSSAAEWFRNKKFLLLVDDVWNIPGQGRSMIYELYDFVAVGDHSLFVYTTRNAELASLAKSYKLSRWTEESSRKLLLKFAGYQEQHSFDRSVDKIVHDLIQTCQGLPVLLSVVGRIMSEAIATTEGDSRLVWHWFVSQQHNLLEVEVDRYGSVKSIFMSALCALDHYHGVEKFLFRIRYTFVEMHRALCVIQKQDWVPLTILSFLWKLENEFQAAQLLRLFASVGLLVSLFKGEGEKMVQGATMHDLFLDYEKTEAKHRGEMTDWHQSVVDGYISKWSLTGEDAVGCREWWRVNPEDAGYFRQNIVRHLGEAGLGSEMVTLVTRPQWIEKRVREDGFILYVRDLEFALERCQKDKSLSTIEGMKSCELGLIKKAVRLSYDYIHDIRENDVEIWFQLHGRLFDMAATNTTINDYVKYIATHAPRPWLQVDGGCLTPVTEGVNMVASYDSSVRCLKVSYDGNTWIAGGSDGRIYGGSVSEFIEKKIMFEAHKTSVTSIAHSRDGKLIASGSTGGGLKIWAQEDNSCLMSEAVPVNGIDFSVDGEMIVSCSQDGKLCSWMLSKAQGSSPANCVERAHEGRSVRAIQVLNSQVFVSAGDDRKIRFWNLKDLSERSECEIVCESRVFTLAVSQDGSTIAAGLEECTVRVWKVNEDGVVVDSEEIESDEKARRPSALAFSGDGDLLIIGTMDGLVYGWNLRTNAKVSRMPKWGAASITGVGMIMVENELCTIWSSGSGTIRVAEATRDTSGEESGTVRGITTSNSGAEIVVASEDGSIDIVDIDSRTPTTEAFEVGHTLSVGELTPDGKKLVFGAHDGYVGIWDVNNHKCIKEWHEHTRPVVGIALSEDGKKLASASSDGSIRVWDIQNPDLKCTILTESKPSMWSVFFGRDSGRDIITVDNNGLVTLWKDGTEIRSVTQTEAVWRLSREVAFREFGMEVSCSEDDQVLCFRNQLHLVGNDGAIKRRLGSLEQNMLPRHWEYSACKSTFCVTTPAGLVGYLKLHSS